MPDLESLKRHFSFLNKLKTEPLLVQVHHEGMWKLLVNDGTVYPWTIDKSFYTDDLCDAMHFGKCNAKCCKAFIKGISLIFTAADYLKLPSYFRYSNSSSFEMVRILVNGVERLYYVLNVQESCPALSEHGICMIHECKPMMCRIPMIHFDFDDSMTLHVNKRLYGGGFENLCTLELAPIKDKEQLLKCETSDLRTLERIYSEFVYAGVVGSVCELAGELSDGYGKLMECEE